MSSVKNVITYNDQQEQTRKQMEANSKAWHTAADGPADQQGTKQWLENENKKLAASLGGSVSFDAGSGTWSGSAAQVTQPQPEQEDYSDYIRQMNEARRQQSLAQLQAAYENNLAEIDRAEGALDGQYRAAANRVAGQNQVEQRGFNEYAAATGLGSGTRGQEQLSRSVALQNDLAALDTARADAHSQLQLQRLQTQRDYAAAMAQAQSEGNYELAAALYQERLRAQEQQRQEQEREYEQALYKAETLAGYGDFSGYADLGYDTAAMERAWAQAQAGKTGSSGGSGSGSYAGGGGDSADARDVYRWLQEKGAFNYTDAFNELTMAGFSVSQAESLARGYTDSYLPGQSTGIRSAAFEAVRKAAQQMKKNGYLDSEVEYYLQGRVNGNTITQQEMQAICAAVLGA